MSFVTTRPSCGEHCHPEGGGSTARVIFWFRVQVVEIYYQLHARHALSFANVLRYGVWTTSILVYLHPQEIFWSNEISGNILKSNRYRTVNKIYIAHYISSNNNHSKINILCITQNINCEKWRNMYWLLMNCWCSYFLAHYKMHSKTVGSY